MSQAVFDALTDQQQQDLRLFAERLANQNRSLNMVAPSTIDDLWSRHILDSLQLAPMAQDLVNALLARQERVSVLDIGTGGGLPAVPLAVLFAQSHNVSVQALDSDRKKIAAIRLMTLGLSAPLTLHDHRVERHEHRHDVVTSRALASLGQLLDWSQYCLKPGGVLLLLKGERFQEEIEAAAMRWNFSTEIYPSVTNADAAVLVISDISPKIA